MGELLALRWRDVDFAGSPVRARELLRRASDDAEVRQGANGPAAPDVASALAQLGQRRDWAGDDDDVVFAGAGDDYLDGPALRRRYKAALVRGGLRPRRFHDLRHTFGTRMIARTDIRRVQEWMGHADVQNFHARYGGQEGLVVIATGDVYAGSLPGRALRLVREWLEAHHDELARNFDRGVALESLETVAPLP